MITFPLITSCAGYRFAYGKSSLSAINFKLLSDFFVSGIDAYYTRGAYDEAIRWATDVKDSVFADADSIHESLMGTTVPGAIVLCSQAFQVGMLLHKSGAVNHLVASLHHTEYSLSLYQKKWSTDNRNKANPMDDRQVHK